MKILNARIRNASELVDIEIEGDRITKVSPSSDVNSDSREETINAGGRFVSPQFVEAHIHLDYANTAGAPRNNDSGTLFEAIEIWGERKAAGLNNPATIRENAVEAAKSSVAHGVGFIRTHVDVTDPELTAFHTLMEVKEEIKDWCELQIVAFPQNGTYAFPNGDKLVEQALREGADVVGGIPHLEPTYSAGEQSLKFLFDLAEKYQKPIDVHCDEIDDPNSRFVEVIAAEASARSMQGLATVSHAVAMGYYSPGYMSRLLPKMQAAELNFAICPNENLHLQGRGYQAPVPRGVAPIRTLVDAGLNVALCQDSISDPWYPMGNGDLIRIVDTGLHVSHMLTPEYVDTCFDFVTKNPAANLGLQTQWEITEGAEANLVIVDAQSERETLQQSSLILASVHKGRKVFERPAPAISWGSIVGDA